jgi:hypothetical protein
MTGVNPDASNKKVRAQSRNDKLSFETNRLWAESIIQSWRPVLRSNWPQEGWSRYLLNSHFQHLFHRSLPRQAQDNN